jgi:hypothetical protein
MAVIRLMRIGPCAFVLPFSPGILWVPFWRKNELKGAIFISKTGTQLPFERGVEELRRKSAKAVEDLNGGNRSLS